MVQRGRKSVASLSIVPEADGKVRQLNVRAAPWPGLNKRERELWAYVVNGLPADWFGPGDLPLLSAYVRAVALHERCSVLASTAEITVTNNTDTGAEHLNPIFRAQDLAAARMSSLAVKLRLTQSSRWTPQSTGTKHKNAMEKPNGTRPWET